MRFPGVMGRAALALCMLLAVAIEARAQPSPLPSPDAGAPPQHVATSCAPCDRARQNLDSLPQPHGETLKAGVPQFANLAALDIRDTKMQVSQQQQLETLVVPEQHVALEVYYDRYGDGGLRDLAALACTADVSPCVDQVFFALSCARSGQCTVYPEIPLTSRPPEQGCDPYVHTYKGKQFAFGPEVATGWRDSALPNDHRAWGFGFEVRRRFGKRLSGVARFDWQTGRDAGIDTDGDGRDDVGTGRVSRVSVLAGPSIRLTETSRNEVWRYLELDVLGGATAMTSPSDENGFIAGVDLSYQLAITRWGLRAWQGFGDAQDARAVLFHAGIVGATYPKKTVSGGCDWVIQPKSGSTGVGVGFDLALSGYELGTGIGYMPPMPGLEISYILHTHLQPIVRGDLTVFTNGDADHVLHHSLLAGARIDMTPASQRPDRTGPFITVLAGYGWGAVTKPSNAGSGPILDGSLGYMMQGDDGAAWVRLHGRFGLVPANEDLRALFLSIGLELRLDRERWRVKQSD